MNYLNTFMLDYAYNVQIHVLYWEGRKLIHENESHTYACKGIGKYILFEVITEKAKKRLKFSKIL